MDTEDKASDSFREEADIISQHTNDETHTASEGQGQEDESITLTKSELEERERTIRKEQDKRWKARLKDAGKDGEEGGKEDHQEASVVSLWSLEKPIRKYGFFFLGSWVSSTYRIYNR
jgi:hypothetical protein